MLGSLRYSLEAEMRRSALWSMAVACSFTLLTTSCGGTKTVSAVNAPASAEVSVAVAKAFHQNLSQSLTISSELVPFQEIDVYAKESGFVSDLRVDYGTHVKANDVMAVLEIPELQSQLNEDDATIKNAQDQIVHAQNELSRFEAE